MLLGYARVSTDDQKMDLQRDALARFGVANDNVYSENVSGAKTNRPELVHCLRALREGDTLVVWRLDRLSRSLKELIEISERLTALHADLISLTESVDTTTASGRLAFNMFGVIAQFERDIISERTIAGLKAARARGHRGGRKPKITPNMLRAMNAMLDDPLTTMTEVAEQFNVSRAAIYRARQRARQAKDGTMAA